MPRTATAIVPLFLALALSACGDAASGPRDASPPADLPDAGATDASVDAGDATTPRDLPPGPDSSDPADAARDPAAPDDADDDPGQPADDATAADAPADTPAPLDAPVPDAPVDCGPSGTAFDYRCNVLDPATCPGGVCALSWCLDPDLDPDRWNACGDGTCDPCEGVCETDCLRLPYRPTRPDPTDPDTITVYVHGFEMVSESDAAGMVYGQDHGCGLLRHAQPYGLDRPCSDTPEGATARDQLASVEYYGRIPADWMTPQDVAEIESLPPVAETALPRYARIVARFIRHKLAVTGARQANVVCHSMGCLITRYIIEHDLDALASESRIPRFVTMAGALAGSRLAALYDNPDLVGIVGSLGLDFADFVLLQPDVITDRWVTWDHRRFEANHPYYGGIQIHHVSGTFPNLEEAMNVAVLDVMNPEDLANDGVLYLDDTYFHAMAPQARYRAADGALVPSTRSLLVVEHNQMKRDGSPGMTGAAALLGSRRVILKLAELELFDDGESHGAFDGQHGESPAEIAPEVVVRYDPYVTDTFGLPSTAHEDRVARRSAQVVSLPAGKVVQPDLQLFSGPVFDGMDSMHVAVDLIEVDWYPRRGVREWTAGANQSLGSHAAQVPLVDGEFAFRNDKVRARFTVDVVRMH